MKFFPGGAKKEKKGAPLWERSFPDTARASRALYAVRTREISGGLPNIFFPGRLYMEKEAGPGGPEREGMKVP